MADDTIRRLFDKLDELKDDTSEIKTRLAVLEINDEIRKKWGETLELRFEKVENRVDVLEKNKATVLGIKWAIGLLLGTFGLTFINFISELLRR